MGVVVEGNELLLAGTAHEVGMARQFAVRTAAGVGADQEAQESVRTLVSELVTNVVLHAGTPAVLAVLDAGDAVRVSVTDGSAALTRQRPASADSTTGRGLRLLQLLSATSGTVADTRISPTGKTVWFTVRKQTGAAERAALTAGALALFAADLEDL